MYEGKLTSILLGSTGFQTDLPHTSAPSAVLQLAKNVTLVNGALEKDFGSERWNQSALPSSIVFFQEYYPDEILQRILAVCQNGQVYKLRGRFLSYVNILPSLDAPNELTISETAFILSAGSEETGNPRKQFIFTGNDPVQVVTGDGTFRRNILNPPADWSGDNQPTKGIIHRGRVLAWGCKNDPHRIYYSSATDHEDFTTSSLQLQVYPGDGERIVDGFTFKGVFFVVKFPFGLYGVNDAAVDPINWTIEKLNGSFGGAGLHCSLEVFDDVLIANSTGSITSLKATDATGDVTSGDLFNSLKIERLLTDEIIPAFGDQRFMMYYPAKRLAYCTYRSPATLQNNRILQFSFNQSSPQVTLVTKDQPNCLGLIRDQYSVLRPHYGASDGFIYMMDSPNRRVHESGFRGEFWTHNLDFIETEGVGAEIAKQFDFIEIVYEPTGDFDLTVEHYVDGLFQDSQQVKLGGFVEIEKGISTLDLMKTDLGTTSSRSPMSKRIKLGGIGKRISLRCYNDNALQNFKILRLNFYYKLLDNRQLIG